MPQSIIEQVQLIDEQLAQIRVCDPAVGSGAFVVSMMNEIVRVRNTLTLYMSRSSDRSNYDFKRHAIHDCLYGVDIDAGAVEIAKLRLWLSLVVDEDEREKIEPLPNLDYKIVRGNSLLSLKEDLFNNELFKQLEALKPLYFNETSASKKKKYKEQIDALVLDITHGHTEFDFEVYFSEVFHENQGFDIVIGNPPYVRTENIDPALREDLRKQYFDKTTKNAGKNKGWQDDLYVHFIFKSFDLCKEGGICSLITNDSFITHNSKQRVRDLLLNHSLLSLVKCPYETFNASIYTAIFVAQNAQPIGEYSAFQFTFPGYQLKYLGNVQNKICHDLPHTRLVFPSKLLEIFNKLKTYKRLNELTNVLDTGIHSGNCRHKIFFRNNDAGNTSLGRLLQGKHINKYQILWEQSHTGYKFCNIEYEVQAVKGIGRGGKPSKHNEYWHFVGNIQNHHLPERLLLRQTDDDLVATYHNEKEHGQFYTDNTLHTITLRNDDTQLKFILALLNSNLLNSLYHFLSQEEGKSMAQVKVKIVEHLPISLPSQTEQQPLVDIVDKILAAKDQDSNANTSALEAQIDQLVHQLYDLTAEEIEIVEETYQ